MENYQKWLRVEVEIPTAGVRRTGRDLTDFVEAFKHVPEEDRALVIQAVCNLRENIGSGWDNSSERSYEKAAETLMQTHNVNESELTAYENERKQCLENLGYHGPCF